MYMTDLINRSVTWDEKQWKVSPGNLAKAIILATFFKVRAPSIYFKMRCRNRYGNTFW